ncbi:MAG TPA: hypothetical protein VKA21_05460 [Candidatus Binatia bacterium]|nr:hypothetical protein [Candidatus Binatia bacterium]
MRRAATALALVLAGCASHRVVRHGAVNQDAVDVVRRALPEVRQLAFTAPVPAAALSRAEMGDVMRRELEQTYAPGDLDRLQAVYVRLGLLPSGTDLPRALARLFQQEGAGFYDPRTKRLVIGSDGLAGGIGVAALGFVTGRDLVGELVLAHELTHALQDQHWGLRTTPEPLLDGHGDRELARRALLEGDATLAGFEYVARAPLDRRAIGVIERQLRGLPAELDRKYPDVPELLRASLAFQYEAGTAFVGWALGNGGFRLVDAIHADPPESTEQVLHPARYFGHRDRPVAIALDGADRLESGGWTRVVEDTLGELQLRVLARRFFPRERADRVADGWGGDRLRALARGGDFLLLWLTAWDSPADAAEFADAAREMYPDARVEERGERVLVLVGAGEADTGPIWRGRIRRS